MPSDLRAIRNVRHLALVTTATERGIEEFLDDPHVHVEKISIPRSGSHLPPRIAWQIKTPEVTSLLSALGRELDAFLREYFPGRYPDERVHGYVAGRSALTNARQHSANKKLLHVDVRDFFPSIREPVIRDALLRLDFCADGADLIAKLVTLDAGLPLGYPTSPLISNVVLLEADTRLNELAEASHSIYTRYADDLTFSSNDRLPTKPEVADILSGVGLELHPTKSRQRKRGQAMYVTGYSIDDGVAHAPRSLKRRLRQEIHFVQKFGLKDHVTHLGRASVTREYDRIVGQIGHVRHADAKTGDQFLRVWKTRDKALDGTLSRAWVGSGTAITLLFDDTGFDFGDNGYRALGTVVLREHAKTKELLIELISEFRLDPTLTTEKQKRLLTKGLHFNDLPPDFRRKAIELVARIPGHAHIAFDVSVGSKAAQMKSLIESALKWQLRNCRGKRVTVIFEQGEYINAATAASLVDDAVNSLPTDRRPLKIVDVSVVSKLGDPCVALPDIVLGAWDDFVCSKDPSKNKTGDRAELLFRTLQPKLGTIYNYSTRETFTSKHPFRGLPLPPKVPSH